MYKLIKLYTFIFVLWTSPNAFAKDCDEYNYPNGLPEGFVSNLSCSRHHQYFRRPIVELLDAILLKKPSNKSFPVRTKCPFDVYGVEIVRINFLASEYGYDSDPKMFQPELFLTGGEFKSGFDNGAVDVDFAGRTLFRIYTHESIDVNDPYVVWCYRTEAAWKNRKNTDKSGPDLKKIFIPYEATYCILEKNFYMRPKDRRLVKFWCI